MDTAPAQIQIGLRRRRQRRRQNQRVHLLHIHGAELVPDGDARDKGILDVEQRQLLGGGGGQNSAKEEGETTGNDAETRHGNGSK